MTATQTAGIWTLYFKRPRTDHVEQQGFDTREALQDELDAMGIKRSAWNTPVSGGSIRSGERTWWEFTPEASADDNETLMLEVHLCDQSVGYRVTFATEDQAIAYLAARVSTHAFHEVYKGDEDSTIPEGWDRLYDFMYPTCEHGLSANLCDGPNHYPTDHPAYA